MIRWGSSMAMEAIFYYQQPMPDDGFWFVPPKRKRKRFMTGSEPGQIYESAISSYRAVEGPGLTGTILVESGLFDDGTATVWSSILNEGGDVLASTLWTVLAAKEGLIPPAGWQHFSDVDEGVARWVAGLADHGISQPQRGSYFLLEHVDVAPACWFGGPELSEAVGQALAQTADRFSGPRHLSYSIDPPQIYANFVGGAHTDPVPNKHPAVDLKRVIQLVRERKEALASVFRGLQMEALPIPIFMREAIAPKEGPVH